MSIIKVIYRISVCGSQEQVTVHWLVVKSGGKVQFLVGLLSNLLLAFLKISPEESPQRRTHVQVEHG